MSAWGARRSPWPAAARGGGVALAAAAAGLVAALAAAATAPPWPPVGAAATYRWTSSLTQTASVLVQQPGPGGQVSWAVVEESVSPPPLFVTYAVVRGDARRYTLQITTHQTADGPPLSVTQVTVDRRSGKAVRSVIQRPKGLIETPESGLRPLREADVPQAVREEVTVPAGQFPAVRGRVGDAQVWVSDRAVPMGLVRAAWPSGTLELIRSEATGARDLLGGAGVRP